MQLVVVELKWCGFLVLSKVGKPFINRISSYDEEFWIPFQEDLLSYYSTIYIAEYFEKRVLRGLMVINLSDENMMPRLLTEILHSFWIPIPFYLDFSWNASWASRYKTIRNNFLLLVIVNHGEVLCSLRKWPDSPCSWSVLPQYSQRVSST